MAFVPPATGSVCHCRACASDGAGGQAGEDRQRRGDAPPPSRYALEHSRFYPRPAAAGGDTIPRPRGEATMPQRPPDVTPEILTGDLTEELLQAYLAGPDLAVDTETMGLQTRRDRLCLVQLCDRRMRAAIVQIPGEALDPERPLAGARSPPQAPHGGPARPQGVPLRAVRRGRARPLAGHRGGAALLHAHRQQARPHLHRPPRAQGQPARVPGRGARQGDPPLRLVERHALPGAGDATRSRT